MPPNVCAYLTFAYGLSRPDEYKTFSFENVRALAVKRRPYANVAEQFKSTLKGKLSFTNNPEKRKYHCEAGAANAANLIRAVVRSAEPRILLTTWMSEA